MNWADVRRALKTPLHLPAFLRTGRFWNTAVTVCALGAFLGGAVAAVSYSVRAERKVEGFIVECRDSLGWEMAGQLARAERLRAEPFFSEERRGDDAGPWLNSATPWDEGSPRSFEEVRKRLMNPPVDPPAELALPSEVLQLIRQKDLHPSAEVRDQLLQLDVGWLSRLREFARWDLTVPPETLAGNQGVLPEPRYDLLHAWARLALLQGLWRGDVREAARDVRHLAWLLMSTESLPATFTGLALLRLERKFHDESRSLGQPVDGWVPVTGVAVDDAQAAIWFSLAALDEDFSTSKLAGEAVAGVPRALRCAAASQWAIDLSVRAWVEGRTDVEPALLVPGCRYSWARTQAKSSWGNRKYAPDLPLLGPPPSSYLERTGASVLAWIAPERAWLLYSRLEGSTCSRGWLERHLRPEKSQ